MSALSWLRNAWSSISRGRDHARGRRRQTFAPRLEGFEERLVPAALSIPLNATAAAGSVVTAKVNVDWLLGVQQSTNKLGYGMTGGSFVIFYQTSRFDSVGNVKLGSLFNNQVGWTLNPAPAVQSIGDTSWITIGISNNQGKSLSAIFGGTLATVDFKLNASTPVGAKVRLDLATNTFGSAPVTALFDAKGYQYKFSTIAKNNTDLINGVPLPSEIYAYSGTDKADGLITVKAGTTTVTTTSALAPLQTTTTKAANLNSADQKTLEAIVAALTKEFGQGIV